jgi:hypothetical protein
MKTQIITLESHDDLISVRDRLLWVADMASVLALPTVEQVVVLQRQ